MVSDPCMFETLDLAPIVAAPAASNSNVTLAMVLLIVFPPLLVESSSLRGRYA
jgi:hypothetical protein